MIYSPATIDKRSWLSLDEHPFIRPDRRFFTYNQYIQWRFGHRIHRVTIDAGFTCPNRDGTIASGGCTYCNNDGFSPASQLFRAKVYLKPSVPVQNQIDSQLPFLKKRFHTDRFLAYFQSYSNTYAPVNELESLYQEALSHPDIMGLAIGTRPDCVDDEKLALLESIAQKHYVSIEYGCESVYDRTLQWVNRAHDYRCFVNTVNSTAGRNIDISAHIILGFPTETREEMIAMADALSELPIDFIKIHNLHIVEKTALASIYHSDPFHIFERDEYIQLAADFVERLSPRIGIQRLYGDAPKDMLIAPKWLTNGNEMAKWIQEELERRDSYHGSKCLTHVLSL
ncbi:TIGR01212 family radical SAM protein [bacterium]|nr:MAG: TIGR01212 family radical SAM protein [bacterium]